MISSMLRFILEKSTHPASSSRRSRGRVLVCARTNLGYTLNPFRSQPASTMNIIQTIEQEQMKANVTAFKVGDSVRVHTRVIEGDKERVQIFTGIVIGRKGTGLNQSFTVRRISYGEGVE